MSHAFSDSAIKTLEKYILANVRVGCELLGRRTEGGIPEKRADDKGWNDQWNAAHWCEWLVFDIMGDLVFGKAFGMLESPRNRFATQLVGNAAHRHLIVSTPSLKFERDCTNFDSAELILQSTTGTLISSSSERLPVSEHNTCNTARDKPWRGRS
jgi:hypothetical protein